MSAFFYYLLTFAESVTGVFGVRFYEQPRYAVLQDLGQGVEIRRYEPRLAVEALIDRSDQGQAANQAFTLLFRYITGANQRQQMIAMTAPVRTGTERVAMMTPLQTNQGPDHVSMRFFLPQSVAMAGAPEPLDPHLHLVQVPEATIAALRYSGIPTLATRDHQAVVPTRRACSVIVAAESRRVPVQL